MSGTSSKHIWHFVTEHVMIVLNIKARVYHCRDVNSISPENWAALVGDVNAGAGAGISKETLNWIRRERKLAKKHVL